MPEPEEYRLLPLSARIQVRPPGGKRWQTAFGAEMPPAKAYNLALRIVRFRRDSLGYMPGDDRIQWPAIPAGVYVPPVPAPEAA